jgi:hypothetical protein
MPRVDVAALIAGARFTPFHFWMLFWSCLVVVFDM